MTKYIVESKLNNEVHEILPTVHSNGSGIMCSAAPLSSATLVAGVCQDPDTDLVNPVDIDIDVVLDACQNLLVVDSQLDICRFSHLSVQEFLEKHWSYQEANGLIAKVCLSLLNDPVEQERDTSPGKKLDPELQDENQGMNNMFNT